MAEWAGVLGGVVGGFAFEVCLVAICCCDVAFVGKVIDFCLVGLEGGSDAEELVILGDEGKERCFAYAALELQCQIATESIRLLLLLEL